MYEYLISSENLWNDINQIFSDKGGVYILKSYLDNEAKTHKPISRLLKNDDQGILYICKANKFLNRVIELSKSLAPDYKTTSHECGVRYKVHTSIQSKFPYQSLCVELIQSETPEKEEVKLLKNYLIAFGELPPLNRNG